MQIKAECAEVIAEVWTLLDGECTPETQAKLRQHLEDCPPCFQFYGLEERIKMLDSAPSAAVSGLRRVCASGYGWRSAGPPSSAVGKSGHFTAKNTKPQNKDAGRLSDGPRLC